MALSLAARNPALCPSPERLLGLLSQSKAPSTLKAYLSVTERFICWSASLASSPLLDAESAVVLFLSSFYGGSSSVRAAHAALVWYFDLMGVPSNPARGALCKSVVEGVRRTCSPPVHHSKVTIVEMRLILAHFGPSAVSPADLRIGAILCLLFGAYLRVSEALALLRSDLSFFGDRVDICIRKSKTDQTGAACIRPILRSSTHASCPVRVLERWFAQLPSQVPVLFPRFSGSHDWLNLPVSADFVRHELRRVLSVCGISRHLTPHSFRGGAASAAIESGVSTRAVMAAGRWKSLGGFSPYVQESVRTLRGAVSLL